MTRRKRKTKEMKRRNQWDNETHHQLNVFNTTEPVEQGAGKRGIKLYDLNEYCFNEIFLYLNEKDLLNLIRIHPNFKESARYAFSTLFKNRFYQVGFTIPVQLEDEKFVLRNVGDKIPHIELRSKSVIVQDVLTYCSQTAERIKIFHIEDVALKRKIPKLPKLVELTFNYGKINTNSMHFKDWCPNLTHLYFYHVQFRKGQFLHHIPSLEHISLVKTGPINANTLMEFFFKNGQLKSIQFTYPATFNRDFFACMNQYLPNLEKLKLEFDYDSDFAKTVQYKSLYFEKLKSLSIYAYESHYTYVLNNLAISNESLEDFELHGTMSNWLDVYPSVTNPLIQYKNLKNVSFHSRYILDDISMLKYLPKLEVLSLNEKRFARSLEEMIDVARNNKALKLLQFTSDQDHGIKVNMQFYKQFLCDFQNRDDLLIRITEHEIGRVIEISKKILRYRRIMGSKRLKFNDDNESDSDSNDSDDNVSENDEIPDDTESIDDQSDYHE